MEGVQVSDEEYFFMSSSTYPHPYYNQRRSLSSMYELLIIFLYSLMPIL